MAERGVVAEAAGAYVVPLSGADGKIAVGFIPAAAPAAHKTSHENGGTDEISVAGLSGVLADPQPPIIGSGAAQAVAGNDPRLTDARVPSGPAGGDLGGIYPDPTVTQARGIRETSGPTTLVVGAIADGEFAKRVGLTLVGGTPAAGDTSKRLTSGTSTILAETNRAIVGRYTIDSGAHLVIAATGSLGVF